MALASAGISIFILPVVFGPLAIILGVAAAARRSVAGYAALVIGVLSTGYLAVQFGNVQAALAQFQRNIQGVPARLGTDEPVAAPVEERHCSIVHWTWRNGGTSYVMVEGVVDPASAKKVIIQAFDAQERFLGVGDGYVEPGGSFSAMVRQYNPTNELKIRATCEW